MKVALIANNPNIQDIPDADIYYHFNSAMHWGKTPIDKSAIVVRMAYTVRDAKTFRCYPNTVDAPVVIACGWADEINHFIEQNPSHGSSRQFYLSRAGYPDKKSPTSGWAVMQCMLAYGGVEVVCVGFDLKIASYYNSTKLHAVEWEVENLAKLIEEGTITNVI